MSPARPPTSSRSTPRRRPRPAHNDQGRAMILIPALVIGLLIGLATGGNLAAVRTLRLRWMPLLFVAIFTQIVIFTYIAGQRGFVREYGPYIHIATLLATLLVMSRNLHIRGMQLIMLG